MVKSIHEKVKGPSNDLKLFLKNLKKRFHVIFDMSLMNYGAESQFMNAHDS